MKPHSAIYCVPLWLSVIGCAGTAFVQPPVNRLAQQFGAAVEEYCVPFIVSGGDAPQSLRFSLTPTLSLPEGHPARQTSEAAENRLVGDMTEDGYVVVGGSLSADFGPLCSVNAYGPGANEAVAAFAAEAHGDQGRWLLTDKTPSEVLILYLSDSLSDQWAIQLHLDFDTGQMTDDQVGTAFLSRVPYS